MFSILQLSRIWPGLLVILLLLSISSFERGRTIASATPATPPILLITDQSSANHFGPYLAEILRAEGFVAFDQHDISSVTSTLLQTYPVVVLAEMSLPSAQIALFTNYVAGGGQLIAM